MIPYLSEELIFPSAEHTTHKGIVAIGGDLSPERLILAYKNGIFPWYNEGDPIIWWSLDPRMVLFPTKLKVSKSMRPLFNQEKFRVTFNQDFSRVIQECKDIYRPGQGGTWISQDMMYAYINLHQLGWAKSVEVWENGQLIGGLYGVQVGKVFCGESMFAHKTNASKFGFISLVKKLQVEGVELIDCQQETEHLRSLGAESISKSDFLQRLKALVD